MVLLELIKFECELIILKLESLSWLQLSWWNIHICWTQKDSVSAFVLSFICENNISSIFFLANMIVVTQVLIDVLGWLHDTGSFTNYS